jgi:hypothetical protein
MYSMKRTAAMTLCVSAVLIPATAGAQSTDAWQFGASVYGWFPSVKGSTTFPPPPGGGSSSDITVDAADIIDSLKFVLMGSFEARKGRWGGFTDFIYMDLGDTKAQTRDFLLGPQQVPADVSGSVKLDLKSVVWTLAGEYRAVVEPGIEVDTFLGARMIDVDQTLNYALSGNVGSIPLADRSGVRNASLKNWDGMVGVKGRLSFGTDRRWFVPYYADVGAGDSELTYQLLTGLGYAFKWGEMVAQWRYLNYDFGDKVDKLSFSGPAIALNFRW